MSIGVPSGPSQPAGWPRSPGRQLPVSAFALAGLVVLAVIGVFGLRLMGPPGDTGGAGSGASGYYHEYTVPTPGERDRGARRIITGGKERCSSKGGQASSNPARQVCHFFYTGDHYASFVRIRR